VPKHLLWPKFCPYFGSQVGFRSSLILRSEKKGGANFGPEHLEHGHLCAPARQKWCEQGNQASTVFGHNLSMRTCSACFLGMPAEFGGPGVQGVAPGEQWGAPGAPSG